MHITLSNIRKRLGQRQIIDGVSLTIQPGETVAVIGPSGGGKSTLLRCLNGLTALDEGQVQVGPHRLSATTSRRDSAIPQVRRLLGMVFQDFQLFPHLSVLDNIIEAPVRVLGLSRSEAVSRAHQLLARVGLADRASAWPQHLSGGQKQRVAIARALAMEPRGLLCDEITSALDPELKMDVLRVLEDLKGEGLTLIMVTHEIGFARRAADRVVFLADGKVLEEGPPQQILGQPAAERTRIFLSRVVG